MVNSKKKMVRFEDQFFRKDNLSESWSRYCDFLKLTLHDFCEIQQGLLTEQIDNIFNKPVFEKLLGSRSIRDIAEFRESVQLKDYDDYLPYFQDESNPLTTSDTDFWVHTSASRGTFKQVPWSQEFLAVQRRNILTSLMLSAAKESGDVQLFPGGRIMNLLPDMPFVSAHIAAATEQGFTFQSIPPLSVSKHLNFTQKIDTALEMGLSTDVDMVIAMTSSLIRIGPRFSKILGQVKRSPKSWLKMHPRVAARLIRNRFGDGLVPAKAWKVKGIVCWGTDSNDLELTIEQQWGRKPIQLYGSSEGGIMAVQDWNRGPLALLPNSVFFEFIPEQFVNQKNPPTVLLDQVEDNKCYELVLTHFYGMPLMRYRQGDMVKITKDKTNPDSVPRISILGRADNIIDIFGIARLNDRVISEALNHAGLDSVNWCVLKEHKADKIFLNLYLELQKDGTNADEIRKRVSRSLKAIDRHWAEAVYTMAYNPIVIKPVPPGTFNGITNNGNGKVYQINPTDEMIKVLKSLE